MEILVIAAATILAYEIALNSELADAIKGVIGLKFEQQKNLKVLSYTLFWNAYWGIKWYVLMYPITLLLTTFMSIWKWVNKLINCPYCLSYHLAWIGLYLITETTLPMALLYALFSIVAGKIYQYIN
jgi:hypothetical protein